MARSVGGRSTYSMADHGNSSRSGSPGFHCIKKGVAHRVYRPLWNRAHTVVRILPAFDQETGQFLPMRDPNADGDMNFTDWIRRYDVACAIGPAKQWWITCDPSDPEAVASQFNNPMWMLYNAINAAIRSGQCDPAWFPLTQGSKQGRAALTKPDDVYFCRALVMQHGDKLFNPPAGLSPQDPLVILALPRSAGNALVQKLNERHPDGSYVHGDILDMNYGMFLDIKQEGTPAIGQAAQQVGMMTIGGGGNDRDAMRYEIDLLPAFNNCGPQLSAFVQQFAQRWVSWDDLLEFPTLEEQVQLICSCGLPGNMIMYALGELYGNSIPEFVRSSAMQPRGFAGGVPGFPQPQGYGQPMMGQSMMGQPTMGAPAMGQPMMGQPMMGQPMGAPAMGPPMMGAPAMGQPLPGMPTMGQPLPGAPAMGAPAMGMPGQYPPAMGHAAPPADTGMPAMGSVPPYSLPPQPAGYGMQPAAPMMPGMVPPMGMPTQQGMPVPGGAVPDAAVGFSGAPFQTQPGQQPVVSQMGQQPVPGVNTMAQHLANPAQPNVDPAAIAAATTAQPAPINADRQAQTLDALNRAKARSRGAVA